MILRKERRRALVASIDIVEDSFSRNSFPRMNSKKFLADAR